jgi:hypothetical protein
MVLVAVTLVITDAVSVTVTVMVFVIPRCGVSETAGPVKDPVTPAGAVGVALTVVDAGDSTEFTTALTVYEYAVPFVKPVCV